MRKPYNGIDEQFGVKDLISKEPFGNFKHWLEQACNCSSIFEPNAMAVATATPLVLSLIPLYSVLLIIFYTYTFLCLYSSSTYLLGAPAKSFVILTCFIPVFWLHIYARK